MGRQKILISVLVLVIIGAGIYYYVINNTSVANVINTEGQEVLGADVLALVGKLQSVEIDDSLFSSNQFSNLRDYNLELLPEPQSRKNPFSPIGVEN